MLLKWAGEILLISQYSKIIPVDVRKKAMAFPPFLKGGIGAPTGRGHRATRGRRA
jgi:hypothetical protein